MDLAAVPPKNADLTSSARKALELSETTANASTDDFGTAVEVANPIARQLNSVNENKQSRCYGYCHDELPKNLQ